MAEEEEDVLDDIFRQLEIANQLESTGRNRVEAATKVRNRSRQFARDGRSTVVSHLTCCCSITKLFT